MKDGAMDGPTSQPSPELQEWLDTRERHQRLAAAIRADGGCIMSKSTTVDPTTLDEPLRSEAIEYLRSIALRGD